MSNRRWTRAAGVAGASSAVAFRVGTSKSLPLRVSRGPTKTRRDTGRAHGQWEISPDRDMIRRDHLRDVAVHMRVVRRRNNFITWQVDGTPTYQLGASAVGPDTGLDGSQVGQRLIPKEPISIIFGNFA
ncbi:hypothetical protein AX14_001855 [Amanita brunnescens Koide BX004]|nr:hypothetical protein AX14_001855 [Amanita brunnescens Koide BX004]